MTCSLAELGLTSHTPPFRLQLILFFPPPTNTKYKYLGKKYSKDFLDKSDTCTQETEHHSHSTLDLERGKTSSQKLLKMNNSDTPSSSKMQDTFGSTAPAPGLFGSTAPAPARGSGLFGSTDPAPARGPGGGLFGSTAPDSGLLGFGTGTEMSLVIVD